MAGTDGQAFTARTITVVLALLGVVGAVLLIALPGAHTPTPQPQALHWRRFVSFLALMSIYGATLRPLGFLTATVVFLLCGFLLLGERRIVPLISVTIGVAGGFWMLMTYGLGVYIEPWPGLLHAGR